MEEEMNFLKQSVENLKRLHASALQEHREIQERCEERIEELQAEHEEEKETLSQNAKSTEARYEERLNNANERNLQLKQSIEHLQQKVRADAASLVAGERAAWSQISEEHENIVHELQEDLREMKKQKRKIEKERNAAIERAKAAESALAPLQHDFNKLKETSRQLNENSEKVLKETAKDMEAEFQRLQMTHTIETADLRAKVTSLTSDLQRLAMQRQEDKDRTRLISKELHSYKASGTSQEEQFLAASRDLKIQADMRNKNHEKTVEKLHAKLMAVETRCNGFKIRLKAQKEELTALRKSEARCRQLLQEAHQEETDSKIKYDELHKKLLQSRKLTKKQQMRTMTQTQRCEKAVSDLKLKDNEVIYLKQSLDKLKLERERHVLEFSRLEQKTKQLQARLKHSEKVRKEEQKKAEIEKLDLTQKFKGIEKDHLTQVEHVTRQLQQQQQQCDRLAKLLARAQKAQQENNRDAVSNTSESAEAMKYMYLKTSELGNTITALQRQELLLRSNIKTLQNRRRQYYPSPERHNRNTVEVKMQDEQEEEKERGTGGESLATVPGTMIPFDDELFVNKTTSKMFTTTNLDESMIGSYTGRKTTTQRKEKKSRDIAMDDFNEKTETKLFDKSQTPSEDIEEIDSILDSGMTPSVPLVVSGGAEQDILRKEKQNFNVAHSSEINLASDPDISRWMDRDLFPFAQTIVDSEVESSLTLKRGISAKERVQQAWEKTIVKSTSHDVDSDTIHHDTHKNDDDDNQESFLQNESEFILQSGSSQISSRRPPPQKGRKNKSTNSKKMRKPRTRRSQSMSMSRTHSSSPYRTVIPRIRQQSNRKLNSSAVNRKRLSSSTVRYSTVRSRLSKSSTTSRTTRGGFSKPFRMSKVKSPKVN
eukprot:g3499.t1